MKQLLTLLFLQASLILAFCLPPASAQLEIFNQEPDKPAKSGQTTQPGAQPDAQRRNGEAVASAAVVVNNKRLFVFYAVVEGLIPTERAERTSQVLRQIAGDVEFDPGKIRTIETPSGTDIAYGGIRIASVSTEDARIAQSSTFKMANEFASKIRVALAERIEETTAADIAVGIGLSILATIILILTVAFISKMTISACTKLEQWRGTKIKAIKIQQAELIGAHSLADILLTVVKFSQILLFICAAAIYILQVLNFFPRTRSISAALAANAVGPVISAIDGALEYLPSLFTLVIIALCTYAVICFARFFFDAIRDRTIHFSDFDPDWAEPSYKLSRFIIIAFALMVALPYLPGWESPAFKQVGLFLGVLVSLGSSGVVSNVMAGAVLTYTNAFKMGDRITIGDCTGDVVQKTLFVTKIRTVKNEVVSVPNGQILNSNVINYSTMGVAGQLILHKVVTIGYETPYEQVEKILLEAAYATEGLLTTPSPFVLQKSLDDYYVSYEINAYTDKPNSILQIYSDLHKNIQDKFNQANLEIMSPQYMAIRDGNETSIPVKYRDESYKPPSFLVTTTGVEPAHSGSTSSDK